MACRRCNETAPASTVRFRTSPATAMCISRRTRSATSSSTAWLRTYTALRLPMAYRPTGPTPSQRAHVARRLHPAYRKGKCHNTARCRAVQTRGPTTAIRWRSLSKPSSVAGRRLSAGRMATDQAAHAEYRAALRSILAIHERKPAQPARQPHLEAVRHHDIPCRLRAQLHAAGAGAAVPANIAFFQNTTERRCGHANDPVLPERRITSMPASIRRYRLAAGRRRIPTVPCSKWASTPTTRSPTTCSTTDLRPGLRADRLQLRRGRREGIELSAKYKRRQFPGLRQSRRGPGESHECDVEPVSVRQYNPARQSRRLDRVSVLTEQLGLYGSFAILDRVSRRLLSILRPASEPRRDR